MPNPLADLRQKLEERARRMRELLKAAQDENRDLTDAEDKAFKAERAEADKLVTQVERLEALDRLESEGRRSTRSTPPPVEDPDPTAGRAPAVHVREDRPYMLTRLFGAMATRSWSDCKVEKRVSDELSEVLGRQPQGLFVPHRALLPMAEQRKLEIERRDVEKTGTASGASLVATDLMPQEFIELLRNETQVLAAGARVIANLVGDVDIPRQATGAAAGWLATETATISESNLTTNTVSLTPKTVALRTEITRRMQKQSSVGIEDLVRSDIRSAIGIAVDLGALAGTGMSGQPTGILNTMGIGGVTTGGGLTHAELVEFETDLGGANALRGRLAYMTRPSIVGTMKVTALDAGSGRFLLEDGMANGYPVFVTNQIPAQTLIFGNWSEVLIGLWGGLDLFADPYSSGNTGHLIVRGFQDVDVALRHAASFSAATDI
jgi:HK97 family phage major capsid protein